MIRNKACKYHFYNTEVTEEKRRRLLFCEDTVLSVEMRVRNVLALISLFSQIQFTDFKGEDTYILSNDFVKNLSSNKLESKVKCSNISLFEQLGHTKNELSFLFITI